MYIQSNSNSVNMKAAKPGHSNGKGFFKRSINRVKQTVLDAIPNGEIKVDEKLFKKLCDIDKTISRPAENRLVMGTTAIVTQPLIDSCNHKVDKETRVVSRNRTIAKIIAGTLVGIMVRGSSYKLVKNLTKIDSSKKINKLLLPSEKYIKGFVENPKYLENYRSTISTIAAILAMCFTNFAVDAPLTLYLTNKFNEKSGISSDNEKEERRVRNNE